MSEEQTPAQQGAAEKVTAGIFRKIVSEAKPEDHKEFVEDIKQDEKKAIHGAVQKEVDEIMEGQFVTYNYLVGQTKKLMQVYDQDPTEVAVNYAIAAGLVIGCFTSNETSAVNLCEVVKQLSRTVNAQDPRFKAAIMATGATVADELLLETMRHLGEAAAKGKEPQSFNPNKGAFADKLKATIKRFRKSVQ